MLSEIEKRELENLIAKMAYYNVNYKRDIETDDVSSERAPVYKLFPYEQTLIG